MNRRILLLVLLIISITVPLSAQVIKIASLAPRSTPWGQGLERLAAEWAQITNGRVRLTIFHGGVAGNEEDSIRKMRLGQIQGAVLTTAGLATIVPETMGMSFPGILESSDEVNYILGEMEDDLNGLFAGYGYEILAWSNAGWINIFSTVPVLEPRDLDGVKISSGTLPEEINGVFRNMGMQPVPVASPEILSALNSGLVEAVIYSPLGVAGYQWFGVADQMLEIPIALFLGNILLDSRAWNRIPRQYHEELKAAAVAIGEEIAGELSSLEADALELMEQNGLEVNIPNNAQREAWYAVFEEQASRIESDFLDNEFMDEVYRKLEEYRR
jgi:TRAP-type C4-dicarboxylate transport system substrate-binding protein